ncbi:hypothetical protein [Algoriphagus sp. Y33]|uniref:hypothetical protein n=1 Tax=Algoriphagus sp. Y33 TaxID=2772483 RepID=UPI00177A764F|nr:hypothetical protein [Algoriphagus sp. Y33]
MSLPSLNKTLRTLKKTLLYGLALLILISLSGYIYLYVIPKGPPVSTPKALNNGEDSFVMYAHKDSKKKSIKVWTYKPKNWRDQDKIVFVMHGGGRNAEDYLAAWTDMAEKNNLLVIAPEFENRFSTYTTNDYQDGNLFTFFGTKNGEEKWAFTVIENIFDHIKTTNAISNSTYDIFGHSAGGQFVHRMVILMPDSRIHTAIAANAGLYTFPNSNLKYPYGIKNLEDGEELIRKAFEKKLIILTGELDSDPKLGTFTRTDLAMNQGGNRLERGANFYSASEKYASAINLDFNWKIDTVPNVGHDYKKMSESSIAWLSKP